MGGFEDFCISSDLAMFKATIRRSLQEDIECHLETSDADKLQNCLLLKNIRADLPESLVEQWELSRRRPSRSRRPSRQRNRFHKKKSGLLESAERDSGKNYLYGKNLVARNSRSKMKTSYVYEEESFTEP